MKKTKPQDNFYQYVNEEWLAKNTIPEGYSRWGSFDILRKKSNDILTKIVEDLINDKNISAENRFIVNLYQNFLNTEARNKAGISPIKPILDLIDNLHQKEDLTNLFINLYQKWGLTLFFKMGVDAYFNDSNVRSLTVDPMEFGMQTKEFYENTHPRHEEIKKAYEKFISSLTNETKINFQTKNLFNLVYNFENELSKASLKTEEKRDPKKIYNEKTIAEINQLANFIDWKNYLGTLGYDKASHFVVSQPKNLKKLNELINGSSIDDLKDLMKFFVLRNYYNILTSKIDDISFEYSSVFSGAKTKKPEKERAINFTNNCLGELLSKEYIKQNFSEKAKQDVIRIVKLLLEKYKIRINNLEWMSSETKKNAIKKVETFDIKIGYPDKWEDFSKLDIKTYEQGSNLVENVTSINLDWINKEIQKINDPVDRKKWYMYAQTVNAYYNPPTNEICFPAAILQAPFYDEHQSHAANLGGIGAVIGHEVSHGFDDHGSQYDLDGNVKNWWTEKDFEQYDLRTKSLVAQYNQYKVNGHNVNGQLTLGENIGDLSGVAAALDIAKEEVPNDLKDFFENYARVWCNLTTDDYANTLLSIDPHSPGVYRTNGILVNINEFHETFKTQPGDPMYKPVEERIKVW